MSTLMTREQWKHIRSGHKAYSWSHGWGWVNMVNGKVEFTNLHWTALTIPLSDLLSI